MWQLCYLLIQFCIQIMVHKPGYICLDPCRCNILTMSVSSTVHYHRHLLSVGALSPAKYAQADFQAFHAFLDWIKIKDKDEFWV